MSTETDRPESATDGHFRLLDLPNELITKICTHDELSAKDMQNLRVTCRLIHDATIKKFSKRFFTDVKVMMSYYSLQTLVDISKHPVFGPCVQSIRVSTNRAIPAAVADLAGHESLNLESNVPTQVKAGLKKVQSFLNRHYEETALEESGDANRLLERAFQSLSRYRNCLLIDFSQVVDRSSIGSKQTFWEDFDDIIIWKMQWKQIVQDTLVAAYRHGCRIRSLKFTGANQYPHNDMVSSGTGICTDDYEHELFIVCSTLNSLIFEEFLHPDEVTTVRSIIRMVSHAPVLKILYLSELGVSLYTSCDVILNAVISRCLVKVYLHSVIVSESSLINFLAKNEKTIEWVDLLHVQLYGSWISLAAWIKDHLVALEQFRLYAIVDDDWMEISNENDPSFNFDMDADDIHAALDKLLKNEEESDHEEVGSQHETDE